MKSETLRSIAEGARLSRDAALKALFEGAPVLNQLIRLRQIRFNAPTKDGFAKLIEPELLELAIAHIAHLESREGVLVEALKGAEHSLVTYQGLRATDLTDDQIDNHLANGAMRENLEWTIEDKALLEQIRRALSQPTEESGS